MSISVTGPHKASGGVLFFRISPNGDPTATRQGLTIAVRDIPGVLRVYPDGQNDLLVAVSDEAVERLTGQLSTACGS